MHSTLYICTVPIPVSYTHLDVYKRQIKENLNPKFDCSVQFRKFQSFKTSRTKRWTKDTNFKNIKAVLGIRLNRIFKIQI